MGDIKSNPEGQRDLVQNMEVDLVLLVWVVLHLLIAVEVTWTVPLVAIVVACEWK
jgi:hypothetical protein